MSSPMGGVRVPYFTMVKRRLQLAKTKVRSSKVEMHGCGKVVKMLLTMSHLVFWLLGCLMLGIVAYWLKHSPELTALLMWPGAPRSSLYCLYALIGTSGLMLAVGFFGVYLTNADNICLLSLQLAYTFVLFVTVVSIGSVAFYVRGALSQGVIDECYDVAYKLHKDGADPEATIRIETLHQMLCHKHASDKIVVVEHETRQDFNKRLEVLEKECMQTIDSTARGYIRTLFGVNVRVVAVWTLMVGTILLLQILFTLLLLCFPGLTQGVPEFTDNPEDIL